MRRLPARHGHPDSDGELRRTMELTPAQRERRDAILEFARARLSPGARERDAACTFDRRLWDEAAGFGLTGLPIPEEWGGSGLDALDTMLAIEALGLGCEDGGLVFSLCAHAFASTVPVWRSRSREHMERYLRDLAAGKLICANGTTEPEAGSDVHAMKIDRAARGRRVRALRHEVLRHQRARGRPAAHLRRPPTPPGSSSASARSCSRARPRGCASCPSTTRPACARRPGGPCTSTTAWSPRRPGSGRRDRARRSSRTR